MWMLPLPAFFNPQLAADPIVTIVDYLVDVAFFLDIIFAMFVSYYGEHVRSSQ
jgi:hypothetical protein